LPWLRLRRGEVYRQATIAGMRFAEIASDLPFLTEPFAQMSRR
jgi:hypothetical protein